MTQSQPSMRDSADRFSLLSITFHWLLAIGYFGLFGLGWYMVGLSYYDPLYNQLPTLHKSFGILLLIILIAQILWRLINRRPDPIEALARWEVLAATMIHRILFAGVLLVLVTGYLIPTAAGVGISVFDWFEVPAIIQGLSEQEDKAGLIHKYLSYTILAIAVLHMLAALKHHFFNRDQTLRRMLGLSTKNVT